MKSSWTKSRNDLNRARNVQTRNQTILYTSHNPKLCKYMKLHKSYNILPWATPDVVLRFRPPIHIICVTQHWFNLRSLNHKTNYESVLGKLGPYEIRLIFSQILFLFFVQFKLWIQFFSLLNFYGLLFNNQIKLH